MRHIDAYEHSSNCVMSGDHAEEEPLGNTPDLGLNANSNDLVEVAAQVAARLAPNILINLTRLTRLSSKRALVSSCPLWRSSTGGPPPLHWPILELPKELSDWMVEAPTIAICWRMARWEERDVSESGGPGNPGFLSGDTLHKRQQAQDVAGNSLTSLPETSPPSPPVTVTVPLLPHQHSATCTPSGTTSCTSVRTAEQSIHTPGVSNPLLLPIYHAVAPLFGIYGPAIDTTLDVAING
ncbi:hypothetical protein BDN71DRAFT_1500737 [Pleurotus eryngii]|uniref:Uncharacterized protein n=1 Tax=Pleurotus eryngii TaxID=5323 RepID=A0A9P6A8T7_PLEER|nr:hypothetical protein BDN71DRAFT_1500737 [Pleurotus eryngii]